MAAAVDITSRQEIGKKIANMDGKRQLAYRLT